MRFIKAVHAAATNKERRNAQAGAHISSAGALRPQKCLVAGKAEGIYTQPLHINGLCSGSLGSIYDEQQTVPVAKSAARARSVPLPVTLEAPVTTSARVVGCSSVSHWS